MNTIFTDSLVRANANPLSGGYTTFTGNQALQLASDNVRGTVVTSLSPPVPANAALYTNGTWPADQGISIVVGALNNDSIIGVILRGSASTDTGYICYVQGTAGSPSAWYILLDNNGTPTVLSSGAVTPSLGDTLCAFVQGSTITFQHNGTTLGTATDATISTGDAGLYAAPATVLGDVIISGPIQGFDFISIAVSPASLNTVLGGQKPFAATVSGQGISTGNVTWFVDGVAGGNATVGTISASGLYVAPTIAIPVGGTVTVTAQSQADNFTSSVATTVGIFRTATIQSYAPNDGANLANFKAACTLFGQNLPTLGWTQVPLSTDVGQVQWNNLTSAVFSGNFGTYFNEENSYASQTWFGSWTAGTTYTGSFNNGNATQLITYTDAGHPQITYNAAQNTISSQYGSLNGVVPNTNQSFSVTGVTRSNYAGTGGTVSDYGGSFGGGAWVGYIFAITGFPQSQNNGTFFCSASSATTLTLSNGGTSGIVSASATATSSSANVGYTGAGATQNGDSGRVMAQTGFALNSGQNNLTITVLGSAATGYGGLPVSGTAVAETHSGVGWYVPTSNLVPFGANSGQGNAWQPYLYEIYQSTDALSATCPIYLKLQYFCWQTSGASGNGFSRISIAISVGTAIGANGSGSNPANGTLTGNISNFAHWNVGTYATQPCGEFMLVQFAGTGNTIPQECDFAGNAGNLRVCMFRQAAAFGVGAPLYFSIERAKDANGNDLDTYFTVNVSGGWFTGVGASWGYTGTQQATVFKPGTGSSTLGVNWMSLGFNQNDMAYSGMIPAFPIFPCPGYLGNPLLGTIVVAVNDAVAGELARCVLYGQTHTYLMLGGNFSINQNAPGQNSLVSGSNAQSFGFGTVGMLWENV